MLGKGENAGIQHFLLFPTMFSILIVDIFHHFSQIKFIVFTCFQFLHFLPDKKKLGPIQIQRIFADDKRNEI